MRFPLNIGRNFFVKNGLMILGLNARNSFDIIVFCTVRNVHTTTFVTIAVVALTVVSASVTTISVVVLPGIF